jgi:ABC-type branched-subunit amino acid transport system permease subunit
LIVAMVVIGGMGSITGAAIAGFALSIVPEVLRKFPPISAIDLMGLVLGVIVAVVLANQLKRFKVTSSPGWKVFMNFLGVIFCALLAYGAFKNFQSGVSPVIKAVFITLTLVVLVGLAFTTGRRTLPGFGYFLFLVGVVVAFQFPIVKLLHKIPVIETNLASTTYTPSDLRWALFAVTLIVVMLARPQGILGHHELSWTAVGKMFGYRWPEKAVAA